MIKDSATPTQARYARPKRTLLNHIGRQIRHPVSRFFGRQSTIGTNPIIDPRDVPGLMPLVAQWPAMQREAQAMLRDREDIPPLGKISPDHRRIASDGKWKSFFIEGYGYRLESNAVQCPTIASALQDVPGLVTAFLSIMEPGTHVPEHRGLTRAWLNCHLPLVLPKEGRCEIAVDGTIHRWEEGQWFVFDETYPHEVWNETNEPRLVLFLQVQRPMRLAGKLAARALFHALRHSRFVQDVRKELT